MLLEDCRPDAEEYAAELLAWSTALDSERVTFEAFTQREETSGAELLEA